MNTLSHGDVYAQMRSYLKDRKEALHAQLALLGAPETRNPHAPEVSKLNFQIVGLMVQELACIRFVQEGMHGKRLLDFFTVQQATSTDPSLDLIVATLASETRALCH